MGIEITGIEQGTPEWHALRLGKPTASKFSCIITSTGSPSKSADGYMDELVYERITGLQANTYSNADTRRGNANESEARSLFEMLNGVKIRQVTFCYQDERRLWGCSPDGLIDPYYGFETKDAKPSKQINRLRYGWKDWKLDHYAQVQGNLMVTGRSKWYLQSHCPGLKPIVIEIERDDKYCAALKVELEAFCEKLDKLEKRIREING